MSTRSYNQFLNTSHQSPVSQQMNASLWWQCYCNWRVSHTTPADDLPLDLRCRSKVASSHALATSLVVDNQPTGNKRHANRCYQCGRQFATLTDLNRHFVGTHFSLLRNELDRSACAGRKLMGSSSRSRLLDAPGNRQYMSRLRSLIHLKLFRNRHLGNNHPSSKALLVSNDVERVPYRCLVCDYEAKWPTELEKHAVVHSQDRPHRCLVCGLSYKWKWDLGRHFDKSHRQFNLANPYKKVTGRAKASAITAGNSSTSMKFESRSGPAVVDHRPLERNCTNWPNRDIFNLTNNHHSDFTRLR